MHIDRSIALHFQHRRSMIGAGNILLLSCVICRLRSRTDRQQSAVVQIRAVTVLLSVISEKGINFCFVLFLDIETHSAVELCVQSAEGKLENTQWGNQFFFLPVFTLILIELKANRRHRCRTCPKIILSQNCAKASCLNFTWWNSKVILVVLVSNKEQQNIMFKILILFVRVLKPAAWAFTVLDELLYCRLVMVLDDL